MGSFSVWHLLLILIWLGIFIPPIWTILKKAGFTPWLSFVAAIPFINIVFLWIFAFTEWPSRRVIARS